MELQPAKPQGGGLRTALTEAQLQIQLSRRHSRPRVGHHPSIVGREIQGQDGFTLVLDRPGLVLRQCSNFRLISNGMISDTARANRNFLTLIDCSDFEIHGLSLDTGRNGLVLYRCHSFDVSDFYAVDLHGYALIVFGCSKFDVSDIVGVRNLAATILCLGSTSLGRFRRVSISGGVGFYNWDAAIHLNHCTALIDLEHLPGEIHEARSILEKTEKPNRLVFEDVVAHANRAQGIYCEGAVACVFRRIRATSNNKEGLCFDWGSVLCTLEDSFVSYNGARQRLTAAELKADFIDKFGLLEDGSSEMKLPGVSFDNGPFNIVYNTTITHNHGGGIKLVRASPACAFWENTLKSNDVGNNSGHVFVHFLDAAMGDVNSEFPLGDTLLDFGPSSALDLRQNEME